MKINRQLLKAMMKGFRVKFRRDCTFLEVQRHWFGTVVECVKHGKDYDGCVGCKDFDKVVDVTDLVGFLVKENLKRREKIEDER